MNYQDALIYFRDRSDYDRGFISNPFAGDDAAAAGLRRTRLLVDALGSPDRAYPIIHVAGTKGKGSTCAFIESVARHAGLRTGMFVTPHLHTVRERTLIDAVPLPERTWATLMATVAEAINRVENEYPNLGRITAFELNTALGLLAFQRESVDLGIVEVGLGGRLDATNVVDPVVAVITPISFDHQAILGDTIEQIAAEKAGIIKRSVPVVVGPQPADAFSTISRHASQHTAPLFAAKRAWQTSYDASGASLRGPWGEYSKIQLGLTGKHQAENAGTALMALWQFSDAAFTSTENVVQGLQATRWPGRFETINESPTVVVDGAHNGASMHALAATLRERHPDQTVIIVLGSYRDKDLDSMLTALKPVTTSLIATRSASQRARDPQEIRAAAEKLGIPATSDDSTSTALQRAMEMATSGVIIVATGSLSIVAETRQFFGHAPDTHDESGILGA